MFCFGQTVHTFHLNTFSSQFELWPKLSNMERRKGYTTREDEVDKKTLRVGNLRSWMDQHYLNACFAPCGEVFCSKVVRNKQTDASEGYGLLKFSTHAAAEKVFKTYNRTTMPQTEQPFRLNWESLNRGDKRSDLDSEYSLFVGNLAPDVSHTVLQETFACIYPSVIGAHIPIDTKTRRSNNYGFVTFGNYDEMSEAMAEMNGAYCGSWPMRTGLASCRKSCGSQQQSPSQGTGALQDYKTPVHIAQAFPQDEYASPGGFAQTIECNGNSISATIYVNGLDPGVSVEDLKKIFSQHGEVVSVRIPSRKGFGFVEFANRSNAEVALRELNMKVIGNEIVRLSWCRNPLNKQLMVDYGNQLNGAYCRSQISEGLPATTLPDPSTSSTAYGTYPVYGNHRQQRPYYLSPKFSRFVQIQMEGESNRYERQEPAISTIADNDRSVKSLSSPTIPAITTAIATQQTSSAAKDKVCENGPQGIAEILRPLKKAREGEATDAPMSLEACQARGTSVGSHADVESQYVRSLTTKGNRYPEREASSKDMKVVHLESRQFLSNSEEHQSLTRCLKKSVPSILQENGDDQNMSNDAITAEDSSMKSLKHPQLSNVVESSFGLEKTFNDEYKKAVGDQRALHSSVDVSTTSNSTPRERDLPSDAVFVSQKNMMLSAPERDEESSRPFRKARAEAAEVSLSLKACNARGISARSCTHVEAQYSFSSLTSKDVVEAEHSEGIALPEPQVHCQKKQDVVRLTRQIQEPSRGIEEGVASQTENASTRKRDRPKGSHNKNSSSHLQSNVVKAEHPAGFGFPKPLVHCQKKQDVTQPTRQDGVASQTESVSTRKRSQPKGSLNKELGKGNIGGMPEALCMAMAFESKGPEHEPAISEVDKQVVDVVKRKRGRSKDSGKKPSVGGPDQESAINEVTGSQTSYNVEENQSLPLFRKSIINGATESQTSIYGKVHQPIYMSIDNSDSPIQKENREEVDKQVLYVLKRNGGLPKGSSIKASEAGPELEAGSEELTFIQTECIHWLSPTEEQHLTLFPFPENSDVCLVEKTGGPELEAGSEEMTVIQAECRERLSPSEEHPTLCPFLENSDAQMVEKTGGPELEAGSKEMMVIQTECRLLLSPTEKDHPTSFPCHENPDVPIVEMNGDQQLISNLAITAVASTNSFEHPQLSNVVGNLFGSVESCADQYNNAKGYEVALNSSVDVTATTHSSPLQHIGAVQPIACRSLPFLKSSLLWGTIESMEVFKILPQEPHFGPLEQYNEDSREGMAIGQMLIFASLMERTMALQLDEPRSSFENKLEVLTDIEECGFTVQPIRTRVEELLRIKDSYNEVDDNSKTVQRQVVEEKVKFDKLQEHIKQLDMNLQVLTVDKESKSRSAADLQRTIDAIKESIQDAISEFNSLVASPW
ncbi:hypothetical protein IFM89_035313 [Coptis chinensis]|uniref:RRM domain-containing protein n=1 Tax=Coptis chinensis TaxID=261450 RepID=A0A835M5N7_9MAGN|nr:hypothetical protein IFM89_035313 [Coptis chinensis]